MNEQGVSAGAGIGSEGAPDLDQPGDGQIRLNLGNCDHGHTATGAAIAA